MKTNMTKNIKIFGILAAFVALLGAMNVQAAPFTSAGGGGNWNLGATWGNAGNNVVGSGVPGASDTAAINSLSPVTVTDTEAVSGITLQKGTTSLSIGTGGNLTVSGTIAQSGGSGTAPVLSLSSGSGTLNLGSAATLFTGVTLTPGTSGSTINYTASAAVVYAAAYDNLALSGGGLVTVNSTTTVTGNLVLSNATTVVTGGGKLAAITGNVTLNDSCLFSNVTASTIGGNVTANGSSTFALKSSATVTGNFTVNSTASYLNQNGNSTLTIGGNLSVASTATFGLGAGAGNDSMVTLTGTSGTISGGATLINEQLTVNGSYTLQSGTTITLGNKNGGITPELGGTGSLINQGTLGFNNSGTWASAVTINTLDCTATGCTVQLNGGATTILPAQTFYNIILNATGGGSAVNLSSVTAVNGNLTIEGISGSGSGLVQGWPGSGIAGTVFANNTGSGKTITFPTSLSIGGINQSAGTVAIKPSSVGVTVSGLTSLSDVSGTLKFDFTTVPPSTTVAPLQVNADASVLNASAAALIVTWASPVAGTYPLITFISGTPSLSGFTTQTLPTGGSLQVSGSTVSLVIVSPAITAGTTLPGALSTTFGTASSAQSESVSGANLTANLTATAQAGFEVSSDNITFGSIATYTQSGGNASGTLYVRLAATDAAGSYDSQTAAILSSTGASSVNVATTSSGNTVSQSTPPGSPVLIAVLSGSTLTLSWDSTTFPGYSVQAQTNSAGVGLGSNWSDTGSGTNSPYATTIDPANPTVFYILAHP
jgi:hypothetical protein